MDDDKKRAKTNSGGIPSAEQLALDLSDALIKNPHLMDELSSRLPTEFSFVLRQLPHDQEAMTTFVLAVIPILEKEDRYKTMLKNGEIGRAHV